MHEEGVALATWAKFGFFVPHGRERAFHELEKGEREPFCVSCLVERAPPCVDLRLKGWA